MTEIFKHEKDSAGNAKIKGFPVGCEECQRVSEWECNNNCEWPENSWKYDEVKYYLELAQWANAGVDLNRINDLVPNDFIKIAMVRKVL